MLLKIQNRFEYPRFQAKNVQNQPSKYPQRFVSNQAADSVSFKGLNQIAEMNKNLLTVFQKIESKYGNHFQPVKSGKAILTAHEGFKPMIETTAQDGSLVRICSGQTGITVGINDPQSPKNVLMYSVDKSGKVERFKDVGNKYPIVNEDEILKFQEYIKEVLETVKNLV